MRRQLNSLLVLGLLGLGCSTNAWCCECIEVPQQDALATALVVFRGRVELVQQVDLQEGQVVVTEQKESQTASRGLMVVTFKVSTLWKGPQSGTIRVLATSRGPVCPGYAFEQGHEYIVYAIAPFNRNEEVLHYLARGGPLFDVPDCPLRVRTDLKQEETILGTAHAVHPGKQGQAAR
jgi:hypothetical protein